jgi:uncharacterized RDD family membrane protein YckC
LPPDAYTPWVTRVLAYLIDAIPAAILTGIGYALFFILIDCVPYDEYFGTGGYTGGSYGDVCLPGAGSWASLVIFVLIAVAYSVWNFGYKQGTTGSSIGKGIMKFKVVGEATGQPIGFGMSIVRQLAHVVDSAICGIGYLFPLWDPKRQTLADKIMKTVCLPV